MAKSITNKKGAGSQKKVSPASKGVAMPGDKRTGRPVRASAKDDTKSPPSPKAKKPAPSNGPAGKAVPKRASVSKPPMPTRSASPPNPKAKKPAPSNGPAGKPVPKRASVSKPPMPTRSASPPSPKAKKPAPSNGPADKTAPKRASVSELRIETDLDSPLVSESQQIDRPKHAAAFPEPASMDGQGSGNILLEIMAQCKESPQEPAQARAEEPSYRPVGHMHKTEDPPYKPVPIQAKQHHDDVFAEIGGLNVYRQIRGKLAGSKLGAGNTKDKVMLMLVPLLAIVMIFVLRQVFDKSPGKARAAATDETPAAADSGDEIEWEIPEPLPTVMRDPLKLPGDGHGQNGHPDNMDNTQNPGQETATRGVDPAMPIRGLVYSEDKSSVVIGNRIAYEGTRIDGVTIVKINRDSVELEKDGKTWVQKVRD
ncbi:MAG: hypothetical protein ACYSWO_18020 [Planctomycetota bacterium]